MATWDCKTNAFYKTLLFPVWVFTFFISKKDETEMIKYIYMYKATATIEGTNNLKPEGKIYFLLLHLTSEDMT